MEYQRFKPNRIQIFESSTSDIYNSYYRGNWENNNLDCVSEPLNYALNNDSDINITASSSSSFSNDSNVQYPLKCRKNVNKSLLDEELNNVNVKRYFLSEDRESKRNGSSKHSTNHKTELNKEPNLPIIGESMCERYIKYDCKIGEGGYKMVYKGFDRLACCYVAWCEIKQEHVDSTEKQKSMLKEIEIMIKLDHPNVVKCNNVLKNWWIVQKDSKSCKTQTKGLVIIQELMNGGTLKGMIKRNFRDGICILNTNLIIKWFYQILDALRYMHSRIHPPIIHRDVKSENCFMVLGSNEESISVKIGDFGLATTINHNSKRNTMIGTVGFMAPEVYEEKYDSKVDIYAFGIMMLEVITNKTPYDECTNVFQVVSKSMGKHLPDIISKLDQLQFRDIIMACVHPLPNYRPTAEELCEHPMFQKASAVVEFSFSQSNKSETMMSLFENISNKDLKPIIDIRIKLKGDQAENPASVIFPFDIYQSFKSDLTDLLTILKEYFKENSRISTKKANQLNKMMISIQLQIQLIIKTIIGERWRRIFYNYLEEFESAKNQKMTTDLYKNIDDYVDNNNNKSTNNFSEYNFHISMYQKATKTLNLEMEKYYQNFCFNAGYDLLKKKTTGQIIDPNSKIENQNGNEKPKFNSKNSMNKNKKHTEELSDKSSRKIIDQTKAKDSSSDYSIKNEDIKSDSYFYTGPSKQCILNEDNNISSNQLPKSSEIPAERMLYFPTDYHNSSFYMPPNSQSDISIKNHNPNHLRHSSEPYISHDSSSNYPINSTNCVKTRLHSGSIPLPVETQSYQQLYQLNQPPNKYNYNTTQVIGGHLNNTNSSQSVPGRNRNIFFSQQPYLVQKYIQSNQRQSFASSPYCQSVFYLPQSSFIRASQNPNIMHNNNTQYPNHVDHSPRPQNSEPILTHSLPSAIGSNTLSYENVVTPIVMQTTLASGVAPRMPLLSNVSGSNELGPSPRQIIVPSNSSQKLNPLLMTSPRPNINRNQAAISPVPNSKQRQTVFGQQATTCIANNIIYPPITDNVSVSFLVKGRSESTSSITVSSSVNNNKVVRGRSFSQVQEKPKSKKPKARLKAKYLLKVIEITQDPATSEVIVVFEALLPMNQMRFSCSLNKEINFLDLSKFEGDSGQFPGELRKKDILESLVCTLKKICHCLLDDINSIPLNEDYVFHPCTLNSGLIKFSDCFYQMQISSEVYDIAQSNSALAPNQYNYLNSIPTFFSGNVLAGSGVTSCSLSRHGSSEDLSCAMPEQIWLQTATDIEAANQNIGDLNKTVAGGQQKKSNNKPISETDANTSTSTVNTNRTVTITTKCTCNPPSKDCCIRIPEYTFSSVKQIMEKLQNPHTKGLIILPQSNEILLRNLRILEIPTDHMFFGLPCSDSSFNVVKGQKDKDFIIAKDTRQSESTGNQSKKCVYQIPSDGAVLLDSTGEIQHLRSPSLVIPHTQSKAEVNELPFELTNKNQSLDYSQIVSVLQSLSMNQSSMDFTKNETFDSPVMLEPIHSQSFVTDSKVDLVEDPFVARRGSGDSLSSAPALQSQVQVECVSFHYVPLPKSTGSKTETCDFMDIDIMDRDLPKQQVRSRKISNESLEAISSRSRMASLYPNDIEQHMSAQHQSNIQKMIVNNQMGVQNIQQQQRPPLTMSGGIMMTGQRLQNSTCTGFSGQFVHPVQNQINQMSQNVLIHSMSCGVGSNGPQFGNPGTASAPVVVSQGNSNFPVILSNPNPVGLNFAPIVPQNQVMLSSGGMLPNPITPMHIQQTQLLNSRIAPASSGLPISSQQYSNMPGLPIQNLINVSQSIMTGSILPGYTNPLHNSISTTSTEQHFVPVSHSTEFISMKDQGRPMPNAPVNIRQMSVGTSPYYDPNVVVGNTDSNIRSRLNPNVPQITQSQSKFFNPYSIITFPPQNNPPVTVTSINQSKLVMLDQSSEKSPDPIGLSSQGASFEIDKTNKAEQTIGRFVIRPVTENLDKT